MRTIEKETDGQTARRKDGGRHTQRQTVAGKSVEYTPCFEDCHYAPGVFGVGAKGNGYTITRMGWRGGNGRMGGMGKELI